MFRAVVLFCAVLTLTKGQTTQVSQCLEASSGPLPINVYIDGCDAQPCGVPQGQNAQIQIVFRAPHTINRMRTVVIAYLGFLSFPYTLGENAETCNFLSNKSCPVEQDEIVKYTLRLPIENFMPVGFQLPIELRIQDDDNSNIVCLRTIIHVLPPVNELETQN